MRSKRSSPRVGAGSPSGTGTPITACGPRSSATVAVTLATAIFTSTLPPPSLKSEVAKIAPTAVFFVYGEKGQNGSETKPNKGFYAAAREPKQIWEVPNGQHIAGITTQPNEYERRVIALLRRRSLGRSEQTVSHDRRTPAAAQEIVQHSAVPINARASHRSDASLARCLIALHFVDANFLQPRPGTSAGDHLRAGSSPWRSSLRAAASLPTAPCRRSRQPCDDVRSARDLRSASQVPTHLLDGSASGAHYSGLLAIAAGAVLLASGAGDALEGATDRWKPSAEATSVARCDDRWARSLLS